MTHLIACHASSRRKRSSGSR